MGKLYIAYGSNLNLTQMAARCPSAKVYSKGILNNWELVYRGSPGNSHATIKRSTGSIVPVLVWEIQPEDEYHLDIYEGYPHYYFKKNIIVEIEGRKKKAMVYIMDERQLPGKPAHQYIRVIKQGYIDNRFDMSFLKKSLIKNATECKYISCIKYKRR